jgi:hypothetical protein
MTLYQASTLTLPRIITIYVGQGLLFVFFIFLAYKILKRDRKRLNLIFSGFFLSAVVGALINFIYGPLDNPDVVVILNFITNFGYFYAPIFLVVFDLILLKSEKVITTAKQLLVLIIFGIAMFGMFILLFIPGFGVEINAGTNWSPVWSPYFFLYVIIVETIGAVIPIYYLSLQIYKKFEDNVLQKKWKFFIYGFTALAIFMYGIFISNTLNNATFRMIMGVIGIILALGGGYLMYYGVGRSLSK